MMKMNRTKMFSLAMALSASLVVSVSATNAQAWEQWIDYGYRGYSETGETWRNYPYPGAHDGHYRYQSRYADVGRSVHRYGTATFTADPLPFHGIYQVGITFRASENRTSNAEFVVVKDQNGNLQEHRVNQLGDGMDSQTLGLYEYAKGQRPYVKLVDNANDTDSDCVDAAYFKLVEIVPDPPVTGAAIDLLLLDKRKK